MLHVGSMSAAQGAPLLVLPQETDPEVLNDRAQSLGAMHQDPQVLKLINWLKKVHIEVERGSGLTSGARRPESLSKSLHSLSIHACCKSC